MLLGLALQLWPDHKLYNATLPSYATTVLWDLNEKRKDHVKTQCKGNKGKRLQHYTNYVLQIPICIITPRTSFQADHPINSLHKYFIIC